MYRPYLMASLLGVTALALVAQAPAPAAAHGQEIVTAQYKSDRTKGLGTHPRDKAGKKNVSKKKGGKSSGYQDKDRYHDDRGRNGSYKNAHGYGKGDGHYGYHHEPLSRRQIRRIVRHHGFHGIEYIKYHPNRILVGAHNRRGRLMTLAFHPYSGELLWKRRAYAGYHGYGHHDSYLSTRKLKYRLADQGFHRVSKIRMKRGYYYARSYDHHGSPVMLKVNAYNGRVLSCDRIY